jgi:hypothetical protein
MALDITAFEIVIALLIRRNLFANTHPARKIEITAKISGGALSVWIVTTFAARKKNLATPNIKEKNSNKNLAAAVTREVGGKFYARNFKNKNIAFVKFFENNHLAKIKKNTVLREYLTDVILTKPDKGDACAGFFN